jgi:hypothetical protein
MARVSPLAPIGEESGGWVGDAFYTATRTVLLLYAYGTHVHVQLFLIHVQTNVGCMGYTRAVQNDGFTILPSLPKGYREIIAVLMFCHEPFTRGG